MMYPYVSNICAIIHIYIYICITHIKTYITLTLYNQCNLVHVPIENNQCLVHPAGFSPDLRVPGLRLHPNGGIVPQRELADRTDDAQLSEAKVVAGQA